MRLGRPLTREDFVKIGQRYHSTVVLKEARQARKRWEKDISLLKGWGFGQKKLEQLDNLIRTLEERLTLYAAEVGAKLAGVPREAAAAEKVRNWILRGLSILDDLLQEDEDVVSEVRGIGAEVPTDPAELATYGPRLMQLLKRVRDRLDPEAADEEFFAEGEKVISALPEATADKIHRRDSKEVATSDLDELDGRIYDLLRRLNENARRAFRQAGNEKRASQYVFYYLAYAPSRTNAEEGEGEEGEGEETEGSEGTATDAPPTGAEKTAAPEEAAPPAIDAPVAAAPADAASPAPTEEPPPSTPTPAGA